MVTQLIVRRRKIKLTHYSLTATIVTVLPKFRFQKKEGFKKKISYEQLLKYKRNYSIGVESTCLKVHLNQNFQRKTVNLLAKA